MGKRSVYSWFFSPRLFPEVALFEDRHEIDDLLQRSATKPTSILSICAMVLWILLIVFSARSLIAPLLHLPTWVAQLIFQPLAMILGFYWLYNYGLRRPFQRALREALQAKGVPLCLGCGYDLRGQNEQRCPECNRRFPEHLLNVAANRSPVDQ